MSKDIHDRLDYLFGSLRPELPAEEPEQRLTPGEKILSSDPELWKLVQQHRQATYEAEAERAEQREIMESLQEAAVASGMSLDELRNRIEQANARGASAPLQGLVNAEYPIGQTRAQLDEEQRQVEAAREEQFQSIKAGNAAFIAREQEHDRLMREGPVRENHGEEHTHTPLP